MGAVSAGKAASTGLRSFLWQGPQQSFDRARLTIRGPQLFALTNFAVEGLDAHARTRRGLLSLALRDAWNAPGRALVEAVEAATAASGPLAARAHVAWDSSIWNEPLDHAAATHDFAGLVRIGTLGHPQVRGALPWVIPGPGRGNVLAYGRDEALGRAGAALVSATLRAVSLGRPGVVRVMGIDAVGIGTQFLELREALGSSLVDIWSDVRVVTEQLGQLLLSVQAILTDKIQTRYASLHELNRVSHMTERFGILLIHGYPEGFDASSARKLVALLRHGSRAGVSVYISVDDAYREGNRALPRDFPSMSELEAQCQTLLLSAHPNAYANADPRLWGLVPTLDSAPPTAVVRRFAHTFAQAASRVGGERIDYQPVDEPWTRSSLDGLTARIGARNDHQPLEVTLGGAQALAVHALVAGKTNSGKSVLLQTLIQDLAHNYSPEELSLYLVDMKEGVEFKTLTELPHAKVVILNSRPELAAATINRVVGLIEERKELFNRVNVGINDFESYRRAGCKMSRVLLVIDEFQMMFDGPDHMDVARKVEDLVTRGRSMGLHLILATQSLKSGAYPDQRLSRKTLANIGARIALQLDAEDSALVLGPDNLQAATLNRKGAAVINLHNGRLDKNECFQTYYLSPDDRAARAVALGTRAKQRPLVLDGAAHARVTDNVDLRNCVRSPAVEPPPLVAGFLGSPMTLAAADHVALFRGTSRENVLLLGAPPARADLAHVASVLERERLDMLRHQEPMAIAATAVVSAALQLPREQRRVDVVLALPDAAVGPLVQQLQRLPLELQIVRGPMLGKLVTELQDDLKARTGRMDAGARVAPRFVLMLGLTAPRSAGVDAAGLGKLLREGPVRGIHFVVWAEAREALEGYFGSTGQALAELRTKLAFTLDGVRILDATDRHTVLTRNTAWVSTGDKTLIVRTYGAHALDELCAYVAAAREEQQ
jgi:hypothetical protein